MSVDAATVREAFRSNDLEIQDDGLDACINLCSEFGLSASQLSAQWDAYSMNNQITGPATAEHLAGLRSNLAQQHKSKSSSQSHGSSSSKVPKRKFDKIQPTPSGNSDKMEALYGMKSPDSKHQRTKDSKAMFSPTSVQSPPGHTYEKRTDAGQIVSDLNGHLKPQISSDEDMQQRKIHFSIPYPERNLQPNAPYMYTPLFDRAVALEDQLIAYEKLVKEHLKLEELAAVGDPSPAQVTVVGRIVCEAAEGKLNSSVVQIEGSRHSCGGQRVLLDLSEVPTFQVFPGKLVALEGVFADVRSSFVVKNIIESIPAPMPTSSKTFMREIHGGNADAKPLRVLSACGPFTTSSNVEYVPLNDLLQVAIDSKPDALILVGPFIDVNHSSFSDGVVPFDGMLLSYEDIFLFKVMTLMNSVLGQNPDMQLILIPSLRDANHEYVYPQPPLDKKKACEALDQDEYAKRVHMLSNPCTFALNDVIFGVSTLDVMMHLSSNELHRAKASKQNRLLRLSEQLIEQHSYYPLFPPPASGEAPLDLRYMKQFQFEHTPDVLILPSVLNRFCGRIRDSICINPGQLCKGQAGGTFASLTVLPLDNNKLDESEEDQVPHQVPDRTLVEIKRI